MTNAKPVPVDWDTVKTNVQDKMDSKGTVQWDYLAEKLNLGPPSGFPGSWLPNSLEITNIDAFQQEQKLLVDLKGTLNNVQMKAVFLAWCEPFDKPEKDGATRYMLGFQVLNGTEIKDFPLVGSSLPMRFYADLLVCSTTLDEEVCDKIYKTITGKGRDKVGAEASHDDYPSPPAEGLKSLVTLKASVMIGQFLIPLTLEIMRTGQNDSDDDHVDALEAQNKTNKVEKKVGPLYLKRFHMQKTDDKTSHEPIFQFLFDAGLKAGPFDLQLVNFAVDINMKTGSPSVSFKGVEVAADFPKVKVGGGLYGTSFKPPNLWGELQVVIVDKFNITVLGGYAQDEEKHPSFFGFGFLGGLAIPIPPVTITGFALGFGINRGFKLPPVAKVSKFPLVQAAMALANDDVTAEDPSDDDAGGGAVSLYSQGGTASSKPIIDAEEYENPFPSDTSDPSSICNCLETMKDYLPPEAGEYWGTAGLAFTVCKIIKAYALLAVAAGKGFRWSVIGVAKIEKPEPKDGVDPVIFAELELVLCIAPDQGIFRLEAQLAPTSYVLSKQCHLTGGFAIYAWYGKNPNADQFLLTLGGYHPSFTRPQYYPKVRRVGFNLKLNDNVVIKGGLYYAFTLSSAMAGGFLEAVAELGPVRAWFDVEADALINWATGHLYYDIYASMHLGISIRIKVWFVHITFTFHLGVDLHLWGPDFSGEAKVDLSVATVTIHIGANAGGRPPALNWSQFRDKNLPPTKQVCSMQAVKGLTRNLNVATTTGTLDWVMDPEHAAFALSTAIPLKSHAKSGNISAIGGTDGRNTDFGVGPMELAAGDLTSKMTITLTALDGATSTMSAQGNIGTEPAGLWISGAEQNPMGSGSVVSNVLKGFQLLPDHPDPDHTLPIDVSLLQVTELTPQYFHWATPTLPGSSNIASSTTVAGTINTTNARGNRNLLLAALPNYTNLLKQPILSALAQNDELLAKPKLRLLGEA